MEIYKRDFIDFLLDKEALKIGEFKLKSGRISPYFINTGMFDDGKSIGSLGYYYAAKIADRFKEDFDIIFGPAYKGIPLSVTTTIALSKDFGINKGYAFNRKESKGHGEATKQDIQKNWIVGHKIENNDRILIIDDVFTTGGTKYESIDLLNRVADNLEYPGLIIAVDRQELGGGKSLDSLTKISAIEDFEKKTRIPVDSIVDISEIIDYLWDAQKISASDKQRLEDYLRTYGTEEAKGGLWNGYN